MNWKLKAIVQKTISYAPFSYSINYFFQKFITKGVVLSDDYFFDRLTHAKQHISNYNKWHGNLKGKTTVELGSGWYPVVPISCFLCGATNIYSVDIVSLTDKNKLIDTLKFFIKEKKQLLEYLPSMLKNRIEKVEALLEEESLLSYEDLLNELNLKLIIKDARNLDFFKKNSIDLIHSNNTFEHVSEKILPEILLEFKRIIKKDGFQSHFIDMSDHFAHSDPNINIYNFLRFTKKQWSIIDNTIQPQNRLRFKDYITMYENNKIPITEIDFRPGNIHELKKINLAPLFASYSPQELAISHGYIFSNKF